MKKRKKSVIYLVSAIILLILTSPFLGIPIANNIVVWRMEKSLEKIPVLEETKQIQTKGVAGKLNGNGNGINYLAALVVESKQGLKELQTHYKSYNPKVEVVKQGSDQFESSLLEHDKLVFQKLENVTEFSECYTIYLYDSAQRGSIFENDFRGH